ncbi:MAG TPA: hypothetical protein VFY24_08055 [Azospira sp.]|nr:hypothetical protein [Azospira sp.]
MRYVASAAAYLLSLVLTAAIAFVVVLVVAGPHAGLLPSWLEAVVLGLGWLAVVVLPLLVARKVWRRFGRPAAPGDSPRAR